MRDVSVVIVSWNARQDLENCLSSICKTQNSLVREVIVVDNNSADGSAEMVAQQFPEVSLIRSQSNLGFAKANNLGIARASGRYLALINSDVIVHPNCLEQLTQLLERTKSIGLAGPKLYGTDGGVQKTFRDAPSLWNAVCRSCALDTTFSQWTLFSGRRVRNVDSAGVFEVDVISGCFWVARKTAVEQVGGLDERFFFYAEDNDWCKRFRAAGWGVVYFPNATSIHRGGASSANAELYYSIEIVRANLTYWRKHFGWPGQAAFYVLSVFHHSVRFLIQGARACRHGKPKDILFKQNRSLACLRWLLTGKGTSASMKV